MATTVCGGSAGLPRLPSPARAPTWPQHGGCGRAAMGGGQSSGEEVGSSKEATASNSQAMHSSSGAAAAAGGSGSAAQRAGWGLNPPGSLDIVEINVSLIFTLFQRA